MFVLFLPTSKKEDILGIIKMEFIGEHFKTPTSQNCRHTFDMT